MTFDLAALFARVVLQETSIFTVKGEPLVAMRLWRLDHCTATGDALVNLLRSFRQFTRAVEPTVTPTG